VNKISCLPGRCGDIEDPEVSRDGVIAMMVQLFPNRLPIRGCVARTCPHGNEESTRCELVLSVVMQDGQGAGWA
jgi:hypothetical protein